MSALPRPQLPPGRAREANDALHELHHRAGWPSLRTLAQETGVSHTTVSKAFSRPALPSWGTLELLVEAMDGDTAAFHQLWLAASTPTDEARPEPRIAGRRAELAVVRRHLESGSGLLLVTGEAGMGKTALVTTASRTADTFVAMAHCLPLSTEVPLLPIADVLRIIHDQAGGSWLEQALGACPGYVASSISRLLPEVAPLATLIDPEDAWSRQRLFQAVGAVLAHVGARRRAALLIEDLHWADTATLDLLEHMIAGDPGVPLVGTWRLDDPDTTAAHEEWHHRIDRSASANSVDLTALSRDETADLLHLLTGRGLDTAYVDRIHRRSLGQPLFTEQLASQDPDEPLPRVLSDLLDRRIDGLGPDAEAVVTVLGVGDRTLPDAVIMMAGELGVAELARGVRELSTRRLLAARPGGSGVQLRHPLFAEAARRRLPGVEAREVHRRLGRALAGLEDASPGEVATHWEAAGDTEQELAWRVRAARAAEARFAGAQAAMHWVRALELWPVGEAEVGAPSASRPQAYFGAMDAWDLAGSSSRGMDLAERALAECSDWETPDRAEVLRKLAAYMSSGGEVAGDELTAEAIALYRQCPQTPFVVDRLAIALIHQAFTLSFRGRATESAHALREARSLLADQQPASDRLREVRAMIAWQDAIDGHLERAVQDLTDLTSHPPDRPTPVRDVMVAMHHSDVLLMAGRGAPEVEAAAERGLRAARHYGLDTFESNTLLANVVIAWIRAGRIERGAVLVDPLTDSEPELDRWLLHLQRVVLDVARGRPHEARERAARLCALENITIEFMATEQALLHVWTGEPGRALELIEGAVRAPDHVEVTGETGQMLVVAARAAADLATQDSSSGQATLRRRVTALRTCVHRDPFNSGAVPADLHAGPQWAAELARLDGTDSVELWSRAADSWDRITRPHDAAYCRWRAAQIALREDRGTIAVRLLKRAATDAREHVPLSEAIAATHASA